jgi:hypothetical protein
MLCSEKNDTEKRISFTTFLTLEMSDVLKVKQGTLNATVTRTNRSCKKIILSVQKIWSLRRLPKAEALHKIFNDPGYMNNILAQLEGSPTYICLQKMMNRLHEKSKLGQCWPFLV